MTILSYLIPKRSIDKWLEKSEKKIQIFMIPTW